MTNPKGIPTPFSQSTQLLFPQGHQGKIGLAKHIFLVAFTVQPVFVSNKDSFAGSLEEA